MRIDGLARVTVLYLCLGTSSALAQGVPVVDGTNLAKNIEQLQAALRDAENQIAQIEQLKKQVETGLDQLTSLEGILGAIKAGQDMRSEDLPKADMSREQLQVNPALADLLRVLLKAKSESLGVAPRLIASAAELDAMAAGERNLEALKGWRAEAFGADAQRLCRGEIALTAVGNEVRVVAL